MQFITCTEQPYACRCVDNRLRQSVRRGTRAHAVQPKPSQVCRIRPSENNADSDSSAQKVKIRPSYEEKMKMSKMLEGFSESLYKNPIAN